MFLVDSYDLCAKCAQKGHPHKLTRLLHSHPRLICNQTRLKQEIRCCRPSRFYADTARTLSNRFKVFRERPMFGTLTGLQVLRLLY